MSKDSNERSRTFSVRDRFALALFVGIYIVSGLELVSFETAAMTLLLLVGLYQLFS